MPKASVFEVLRAFGEGSREDFRRLAFLAAGYSVTSFLPRRFDRRIVDRLLRGPLGLREGCVQQTRARMQEILGPFLPGADFDQIAGESCRIGRENQWLWWRAMHTEDVPVETSVEGLERIQEGLNEGAGVILWGLSFCDSLVGKIALQRAGVALIQLSSVDHGVSLPPTRLGLQVVGPFHCVAENRFLAERVMIPADGSLGYMRVLIERLSCNGCVYISGERKSKRKNVSAQILGRDVLFAPGAPGLAWRQESTLLPFYVVHEGLFQYRAVVGQPIEVNRSLKKEDATAKAVRRFARLVEGRVLERPSDWDMWRFSWPFWDEAALESSA